MSLGRISAVGTVGSERSRALRLERESDDRARDERQSAPIRAKIKEATDIAARTAGNLIAAERQVELNRVRRELTSAPSPEFQTVDYDGRFKSAAEVTAGIDAAYAAFKARTADEDVKLTYDFLQAGNWQKADTTRLEVWEASYQFCLRKLKAVEDKYAAPDPEPAPEPETLAPEDKIVADLQRQLDALPVGNSRERERLERLVHQHQIKKELLLDNETFRNVMLSICDDSGLQIPAKVNLQFLDFLKSSAARDYQQGLKSSNLDEYALNLRLAFSQFTATDSWLSVPEKQEQARRRNIAGYTSDQVKVIVGSTNSYGSGSQPGIR
jgi:hypothetical protein